MATLAHILQLVGGWIAPLIIFFLKRNSRFVSFQALQALLLQGLYFLFMMIVMGGFFAVAIAGFVVHQSTAEHSSLPAAFFFLFPVLWLGIMGWWIFMLGNGNRLRDQGWEGRMGGISRARPARPQNSRHRTGRATSSLTRLLAV